MIFSYSLTLMSNPSRRLPVDYERKHSSKFVLEGLLNYPRGSISEVRSIFKKAYFPDKATMSIRASFYN